MFTLLLNVTDREEHEKYFFMPQWKYGRFTCDNMCHNDQWVVVKRRLDHYILFSVVSNTLQNLSSKDNMSNTSAITAVIKYSMKPWHSATTNCHLCGYGERKEGTKKIKIALWCMHCTYFGWWKGLSRDKAMRISKKKRLVSLSSFWVALVWRHQIFS